MKTSLIITATIAALTMFGIAPSAEARSYDRHSSYENDYRYGAERHRYDRCDYPVYRPVPRYCPPPRYYPPPRYCPPPRRHYYRPPVCPPPYHHYGYRPRSGVVISGVFGL